MQVFEERGKPDYQGENLSEQRREPTNSTHIEEIEFSRHYATTTLLKWMYMISFLLLVEFNNSRPFYSVVV